MKENSSYTFNIFILSGLERWFDKNYRGVILATLAFFALLYGLLSITNHLMFKTYCLDLGLYNHALYQYGHLQMPDTTPFLVQANPLLSDHFDLYLIILAPLGYLMGPYTLLIMQILSVLLGGLGVYCLMRLFRDNALFCWLAMVSFLSFFGVWHALGFDYHSSVIGAMLVPWLMWAIRSHRFGVAAVLVAAICIGKETMPLWMIFICLALMWDYRKDGKAMRFLVLSLIGSIAYFVLVFLVLMPSMGDNGQVMWRYSYMGNGMGEWLGSMMAHPMKVLGLLFCVPEQGFSADPWGHYVLSPTKVECYICLLLSCAFLLLKPNYWIMLIPILGQRMLTSDFVFWGIFAHYNVELAPISVIGGFVVLAQLGHPRFRNIAAMVSCVLAVMVTCYCTNSPQSYIQRDKVRITDSQHYQQNGFHTDAARRLMKQIPADASVCATTVFFPHLAMREHIWQFPTGVSHDPGYYLLAVHHESYDSDQDSLADSVIADTTHYAIVDSDSNLVLLKRL